MDAVAFVRVDAVDGVDAIVEYFEALGVIEFCTEHVAIAAADFGTECPVQTRGDGQVFVRTVQELKGVACESCDRALAVFGGANVELAFAILGVADFDAKAADVLVAGDDGVAASVTPEVIIERACVIAQVTEDEAYVLERSPAEFYTIKVEAGVAVARVIHGRRTGESVTDFCRVFGVRRNAFRVSRDFDGNVFVEVGRDGKVDVLACGVGGVKILVEIAGKVKIDVSVDFDVCGKS